LQGRLFALAYSYAGDREDARDLAQEIFVRLFEARSHWPSGDEFLPWLFRVARNRSVDYLRRRSVRRPAVAVDEAEIGELPDSAPGAEAQAIEADRRSLLRAALKGSQRSTGKSSSSATCTGWTSGRSHRSSGFRLARWKSRASRARVELAERVLALSRGPGET